MNIEEYINSGIIEAYALGVCSAEEAAQLEQLCATNAQVKQALFDAQTDLENYAMLHAKTPSAAVKNNLLNSLTFAEETTNHNITPQAQKISLFNPYSTGAAAVIVISLLLNILLYNRLQTSKSELVAALSQNQQMAESIKGSQVRLDNMNTQLSILTDTNYTKIMLKGLPVSPTSLVAVYWNKTTSEVYMNVNSLPKPAAGKQYQLWAIVDGKPQDAGMIPLDSADALIQMKNFPTAQAFAITLEKEGGVPAPTLSELYVLGNT